MNSSRCPPSQINLHSQLHLDSGHSENELPSFLFTEPARHRPGTQCDASPARQLGFPRVQLYLPPAPPTREISSDGVGIGRNPGSSSSPVAEKSKRVRTGCLTCRERHLKCDERVPDCHNCLKSKRQCKRGLRLNFIDIQVKEPPCLAPTTEWSVSIQDESRLIASEYEGGLGRYSIQTLDVHVDAMASLPLDERSNLFLPDPSVPATQLGLAAFARDDLAFPTFPDRRAVAVASSFQACPTAPACKATTGERDYLSSEQEIQFLQVFVDEVAVWMDCLDKDKHFTNVVPYMALKSPMLLNALLACGARHLASLGACDAENAGSYYDIATELLLRDLETPGGVRDDRVVTAVLLEAYDAMIDTTDRSTHRMDRPVDAHSLIRECGWDATSAGLGAACFWAAIHMDVLNSVSFNRPTFWDPDLWGIDPEFSQETSRSGSHSVAGEDDVGNTQSERAGSRPTPENSAHFGDEELWVQRIFYIMAKVANFHADRPRFQSLPPHDEQVRQQSRISDWNRLKAMCDAWNRNCPRTMRPYGYSPAPSARSLFPNVWLIKGSAKLGRLFYHTTLSLLTQVNPLITPDSKESRTLQEHHAHHVCGIIAHAAGDRAVASVAIRGLAIASTVLANRREQNEMLVVLERISRETGWSVGRIAAQLKRAWGWKIAAPASFEAPTPYLLPPAVALLGRDGNQGSGRTTGFGSPGADAESGNAPGLGPSTLSLSRSPPAPAPSPSIPRQLPPLLGAGSESPPPGMSPAGSSAHKYSHQRMYGRPVLANALPQPFELWSV